MCFESRDKFYYLYLKTQLGQVYYESDLPYICKHYITIITFAYWQTIQMKLILLKLVTIVWFRDIPVCKCGLAKQNELLHVCTTYVCLLFDICFSLKKNCYNNRRKIQNVYGVKDDIPVSFEQTCVHPTFYLYSSSESYSLYQKKLPNKLIHAC